MRRHIPPNYRELCLHLPFSAHGPAFKVRLAGLAWAAGLATPGLECGWYLL